MLYATPSDLLGLYDGGKYEIAQRVFPQGSTPDPLLLQAIADNANLMDFDDDAIAAGLVAMSRLNTCLESASAIAEDFLRSAGYALPPVTVPQSLKRAVCTIARYDMYDDLVPEDISSRQKDAMSWLAMVAKGTVRLDIGQVSTSGTPGTGSAQYSTPERVFSDSLFSGGIWRY